MSRRGGEPRRVHAHSRDGAAAEAPPCKINSFSGSKAAQACYTGRTEEERKGRGIMSCIRFTINQYLLQTQSPIELSGTSPAEKLKL